jgi:hypothetical protein
MHIIQYFGHIEPRSAEFNSDTDQNITDESRGISARFRMRIQGSEVHLVCNLKSQVHPNSLYVLAYDMCRLWINMHSFATGISYTLHFDEMIDYAGRREKLSSQFVHAKRLCTAYNLEEGMKEAWLILVNEAKLFVAFNDLMHAVVFTNEIPVATARVLDTIRVLMAPKGMKTEKAWPYVQKGLGVSEAYLKFVTDISKGPRHGDITYASVETCEELLIRAWTVMNRFIEYRKRGNLTLPLSEFPAL